MIPIRHWGILLLLFAAAVVLRVPQLGRPMGKHHEFCTATALRVLSVWQQEGIATVGYNPATNFAGAPNKHINNHASGSGLMVDAQGNYYYTSHPPFAYYLPYAVFTVLDIEPSVLPLQIFNLFIHLFCGLGVYLLARRLLPDNYWVGAVAAGIYWFVPATLWFQGNIYMSDMLVQPFFIMALLWALQLLKVYRKSLVAALGLTCFLATYTTWFGLLVAGSMGLYFLYKARQKRAYIKIVLVLAVSQLLALGLMGWQYSQIAGFEAYWGELLNRFGVRAIGGRSGLLDGVLPIILNYAANYGLLLLLALMLAYHWRQHLLGVLKPILLLGLLPILLLHLLLPNYSGHDFTTLYLAAPLSIWLAVQLVLLNHKRLWLYLAFSILVNTGLYWWVNPYGDYSMNNQPYSYYYNEAQLFKAEPTKAIIFVQGAQPEPETLWYAKRNVAATLNEAAAVDFMRARGIGHGVLFKRNVRTGKFERVKALSL